MKRFNRFSQVALTMAGAARFALCRSAAINARKSMQPETPRKNSARDLFNLCSLALSFAVTLTLFPPHLSGQMLPPTAPKYWLYVNDNNNGGSASGKNTVYGFHNSPANDLVAIGGEPSLGWPSHGNNVVHNQIVKDQAMYAFSSDEGCLFVSESLPSPGMPNGDIAAFRVDGNTGVLYFSGRFAIAAGNTNSGIALTTRKTPPTLYAGYSGSNTIAAWKIDNSKCGLTLKNQLAVTSLNGGAISGMAETPNGTDLVVSYGDGSIQSIKTIPGFSLIPDCATAIDSTGHTDGNNGFPEQVDITSDSLYAVFGDQPGVSPPFGPTELEMIPLPIGCSSVTTDFGGSIVANGSFLGSNLDSTDIWISPDENFIYITNEDPTKTPGFTTVAFNESAFPGTATMSLATGCTAGFANPINLKTLSGHTGFWEAQGIQTHSTTGHGTRVYVGEEWKVEPPASVGMLDLDVAGCTKEYPGSPFANPGSTTGGGAGQLSAWPPRPF
jgi:hypothetical protein